MNEAWLAGDLAGVDPREDMGALLDAVRAACDAERDVSALFVALAAVDSVAAAELAAGMRAISHPRAVLGALAAAPALEEVMSAGGLYARLAALVPEAGSHVLTRAIERHPGASWLTSLARRVEAVPGTALLAATRGTADYISACERCAQAGFLEALAASVCEQPDLTPLSAAVRARGAMQAMPVAVATLHADPDLPVVEAVAALVGPDVDAWAHALFAHSPGFASRYAGLIRELPAVTGTTQRPD